MVPHNHMTDTTAGMDIAATVQGEGFRCINKSYKGLQQRDPNRGDIHDQNYPSIKKTNTQEHASSRAIAVAAVV